MEKLEMYSVHSEAKFLGKLLQNECGRVHRVCSELQHKKCQRAKKCLGNKYDPAGIRQCKRFVVAVSYQEKPKRRGKRKGD